MEVFKRVLAASILLLCLVTATTAFAEAFDERSRAELEEILLDDQFQPRSLKKSKLDIWKEKIWSSVLKEAIEVWDSIEGVFESLQKAGQNFPGAEFIRSIFSVIADLLEALFYILSAIWQPVAWLLFALVLGGGVYLFLRHYESRKGEDSDTSALKQTPQEPAPNREQLKEFLSNTNYVKALCYLRDLLRFELLVRHKYHPSNTDREIAHNLPETEHRRALFQETSQIFEQIVYAGKKDGISKLQDFFSKHESIIFR